ncbi:hypothetical protein [Paraburkholderia aromaticivorans]|uniref:hypothetical protein n=1 Tax=Paraburkholderia aromaticivorans TaxID=2026199 RepID=UPI0038BBC4FE
MLAFLFLLLFVGAVQAWAAGNCIVAGAAAGIHFGWLLLDAQFVAVLQYHASEPEVARRGYVLYRVAGDAFTEYLSSDTPFLGQQIPLAWASGSETHASHGCSIASRCTRRMEYLADDGVVRFCNKDVRVTTLN